MRSWFVEEQLDKWSVVAGMLLRAADPGVCVTDAVGKGDFGERHPHGGGQHQMEGPSCVR